MRKPNKFPHLTRKKSKKSRAIPHLGEKERTRTVMAFQPANSVIHAKVMSKYLGQDHINNLYFYKTVDTVTADEVQSIAEYVMTVYHDEILPYLHPSFSLVRVIARDLTIEFGRQYETTIASGIGGLAGDSEPGNVALFVKFQGATAGRGSHGGNSMSGAISTNVVGNTFAVDWADTIRDGFANYLNVNTVVANYAWVILNRVFAGVPAIEATPTFVGAAVLTDYNVDSRRSRLNGRGS